MWRMVSFNTSNKRNESLRPSSNFCSNPVSTLVVGNVPQLGWSVIGMQIRNTFIIRRR